jgi:sugar lactone lactonase YvrE
MPTKYLLQLFLLISLVVVFACKNSHEKAEPNNHSAEIEFKINAELGEGAFWNYKTQEFYWVDIIGKSLNIYNPTTKSNKNFEMPSAISTVVAYTNQEAVVALVDGIYKINLQSGELRVLSDVEKEMTWNRFNDGKCDPNGNLWVGSMHYDQNKPLASVYKIEENGNTTKMIDSVTISNGIVWTKDSKTMYYIDTPTANIMAYDFNTQSSTISNGRVAVKVKEKDGFPDGMTIDENDMLWVGMWNGNAIANYNPKTGELVSKIEVPAHNVTSCAFGGENLDTLYITTSSLDMTDEEKEKYPLAGSIFKIKPGVKGVKSSFFGNK